ncbi:MAG: OmpA family protein [Candidatus Symbiobacter sp.]|nr:OmpA family protein [Candidatus Symbiobacter sp.]
MTRTKNRILSLIFMALSVSAIAPSAFAESLEQPAYGTETSVMPFENNRVMDETGNGHGKDRKNGDDKPIEQPPLNACGSYKIFFRTAKYEINEDSLSDPSKAMKLLECWAKEIAARQVKSVTINGHCDERPIEMGNQLLSENRAAAVSNYLKSKITTQFNAELMGLSDANPNPNCHNETCWKDNRWVEIFIGQ